MNTLIIGKWYDGQSLTLHMDSSPEWPETVMAAAQILRDFLALEDCAEDDAEIMQIIKLGPTAETCEHYYFNEA
jgi:hypothetical protein